MSRVIDADTHVSESTAMWQYFDRDLYVRRPVVTTVPEDTVHGDRNAFWLIDGFIYPRPMGRAGQALITPAASAREQARKDIALESRELTVPAVRLADMDRLGVDTQIVFPTLFLCYLTEDVELEVALYRAYNRFMGEACEKGNGRLRWAVVPPLRNIEASLEEMRWGKEHGACGVFFRGMEGDRSLADPYFFPIYQAAGDLDLAVCVHTGPGDPGLANHFKTEMSSPFMYNHILPVVAFRDLLAKRVPERFPNVRWGFIEAGSSWVPYILDTVIGRRPADNSGRSAPDLFNDYHLYVACLPNEDIEYLAKYTGEDHLITGSDYSHLDPAAEPHHIDAMRAHEELSDRVIDKILGDNAKTFYGI
jgi:predicted TIM-barrel fold metal-dependent hydrolase